MLATVLPAHDGPTATARVALDDSGLELRDGVEAKDAILAQLARALEVIRQHDPARIVTLGGECAVSVAPFSELARRYGDDLAVVWIDSHPDIGTPASQPVLGWLAATGCSGVAIHFDVDTIDSNEIVLELGAEPDGLTSTQVRRIVADIDTTTDVVALTVAEFIPRQVMHLQQLPSSFPLLGPQGARRPGPARGSGERSR